VVDVAERGGFKFPGSPSGCDRKESLILTGEPHHELWQSLELLKKNWHIDGFGGRANRRELEGARINVRDQLKPTRGD